MVTVGTTVCELLCCCFCQKASLQLFFFFPCVKSVFYSDMKPWYTEEKGLCAPRGAGWSKSIQFPKFFHLSLLKMIRPPSVRHVTVPENAEQRDHFVLFLFNVNTKISTSLVIARIQEVMNRVTGCGRGLRVENAGAGGRRSPVQRCSSSKCDEDISSSHRCPSPSRRPRFPACHRAAGSCHWLGVGRGPAGRWSGESEGHQRTSGRLHNLAEHQRGMI